MLFQETVHKLLQTAKEAAGQLSISRVGEQEVDPYSPRELERLAGKTTHLHDATGRSLHDLSTPRSNITDKWPPTGFEEDPFQLLMDLMAQQHQPQADTTQPRPASHGVDCLHTILEQDLKDLELGKAFTNMRGINDIPSLKPHPPPPAPSTPWVPPLTQPAITVSSSSSGQREQGTGSTVESSNTDASIFSDAQLASFFGFGIGTPQYGQNEQSLSQPGAGGLLGGNALITLDPSLQMVAEHLGFYNNNSFSYNPYFTSLSY